jgi:hypothetical protein
VEGSRRVGEEGGEKEWGKGGGGDGGGGWLGKRMCCSFLPRAKPGTLLVSYISLKY